jgi:hypothetical protein
VFSGNMKRIGRASPRRQYRCVRDAQVAILNYMQDDQRRLPLLCKHGSSVKRSVTTGAKIRRQENLFS